MNNDDRIFEILENQREFDRYFLKKCPRDAVAETSAWVIIIEVMEWYFQKIMMIRMMNFILEKM